VTDQAETDLTRVVREATGSPGGRLSERIQSLWSGYGAIHRFETGRQDPSSFIVKHVRPPSARKHPRGWSSDRGHERKLRSYEVETNWYRDFAGRCDADIRVPQAHDLRSGDGEWLFVLEDLDEAGFPARRSSLTDGEMRACLTYLAHFHAAFLGDAGGGLWEVGTYWHLATRSEELQIMKDKNLREAAGAIDDRLNAARFSTVVHGDAKVANFCFPDDNSGAPPSELKVAAVDFQYVGRGVGVKDVAYFLRSCLDEYECEHAADEWLETYFEALEGALKARQPQVSAQEVIAEWRALYALAWADFVRFLVGWAPDHYKIHGYSEKMTRLALKGL
jgi:hypothetical protein